MENNKQSKSATKIEEELRRQRDNLEKMLKDRTRELETLSQQLREAALERRNAEDILRQSEEKYRNVVERANDGIIIVQGGIIKFANSKMAELNGSSTDQLVGTSYADHVHPSELPRLLDIYRRRMAGEILPSTYETMLLRKDGSSAPSELNAGIITYDGKPADLVIVRDITERKLAEDVLRKSEERYRLLFENMLEGFAYCRMFYVDDTPKDIVFIRVNGAFNKLTGLKDVVEKKLSEVIPGIYESNPELLRILGRTALTGKPERFETHSESFGGWLDVSVYCHEKEHVIVIFDNITERKLVERSLAEKEARLRLLVETIPDLIWLKDADGVYLTCNKMCEQFLGAKESDIVGKTEYDFVNKELADAFREDDHKAMAEGKPSSTVEWVTFASDGHRALMNTIKTPMYDAAGNRLGVLGIGRDITEYQKLEEQLRHAQKLEGIGTLAGGIAHDFNNILSAIIGYGHVTLMKMPKDDPLRVNIEHMLESADRAAALTQSLLAFSRKQITNRKLVDLNSLIGKVDKFLARIIGEDVVVRLALAEGALNIFADAGQLEQVFMNLATNARDAMPNGGLFRIETSIVKLDSGFVASHGYGKEGVYAMISATDTGGGMTEETRLKIFEPFFTTKGVGKGTGLGLAMVYGILKQHEGFINVYSEPGKGTTFRIYLPLITAPSPEDQETIAADYPKGGTETILLAEDDASLRQLNVLILEQMGYTVITASNGDEAVTKFMENKDRIQLLLFDIIMPKKNGREAYEEIRKVMPNVPALFASGYSPDMLIEKALIENDTAVVYKPISPQDLSKKVRNVLDGAR